MHEPVDDYPPPRRLAALKIEGVKIEENTCYLTDTWENWNHEVQLERVGPKMWVPTKQILVWGQFGLRFSWMNGPGGSVIDTSFAPDLRSFTAGELGCAGV